MSFRHRPRELQKQQTVETPSSDYGMFVQETMAAHGLPKCAALARPDPTLLSQTSLHYLCRSTECSNLALNLVRPGAACLLHPPPLRDASASQVLTGPLSRLLWMSAISASAVEVARPPTQPRCHRPHAIDVWSSYSRETMVQRDRRLHYKESGRGQAEDWALALCS